MQLGDLSADERAERARLDVILDQLNDDISDLVEAVDAGALDELDAAEKVAFLQRFESLRNRLPLVDHGLIAHAECASLIWPHLEGLC